LDLDFTVKRFIAVRSAALGRYSPSDNCIYYLSDTTGQPKLWRLCGGRHDIVLPWERRIGDYVVSRGGLIAFTSDFNGDERWAIYIYDGRSVARVAGEDGSMNLLGAWNREGDKLAYASNSRNGVDFDLYVYDVASGRSRPVYRGEGIIVPRAWAGDRIIAVKRNSNLDSDIILVDARRGEAVNLTRHGGEAENDSPAPIDSSRFLYVTNEGREFKALAVYDLERRSSRVVFSPEWDVETVDYNSNRGVAVASVNEDGASALYEIHVGEPGRVVELARRRWVVTSIHASEGVTVVSSSSPREGNEVYLLDGGVERVTWSPKMGLEELFVEPRGFEYESFDGRIIKGLLYEPRGSPPYPTVMWLHGGPESQARYSFSALQQAIVNLGAAVAAPNFRGSTGYGKTFVHLDDVEKRIDAVKDVYYAAKHLVEEGVADPERLCVMGASYGGYLTLMSLAMYPRLWRCGIEMVGIVNLVTFIKNTSPYRRRYRIPEYGDPELHRDIMLRLSPITHAHKIEAPLMVIHGANDPRVPVSEA
jgi:dipeptidyl aminopeptidase/acylaminoacyl peptidase